MRLPDARSHATVVAAFGACCFICQEGAKLLDAFKKPEFRQMFKEYVDEISDPKNRQVSGDNACAPPPTSHARLRSPPHCRGPVIVRVVCVRGVRACAAPPMLIDGWLVHVAVVSPVLAWCVGWSRSMRRT